MPQQFGPNPGNGKYYPIAIEGSLYAGGNTVAVPTALNAGLGVTIAGGLTLVNPLTSGVNLVIQSASATFSSVAQTNSASIGVAVGYSAVSAVTGTLTTVVNTNANLFLATTNPSQGHLYSSASVVLPVAPTLVKSLGAVETGALTTEVTAAHVEANIDGSIVLPPGGYATFVSSAAGTAGSFMGNFSWAELPSSATAG